MRDERIAVVGVAAVGPAGLDIESFWTGLMTGAPPMSTPAPTPAELVVAAIADAGHDPAATHPFGDRRVTTVATLPAALVALRSGECGVAVVADPFSALVLRRCADAVADHDDVRALLGTASADPAAVQIAVATGVAEVVAAALALHREVLPRAGLPPLSWPRTSDGPRRALVEPARGEPFVLVEAPAAPPRLPDARPRVLTWTAATEAEERAVRARLARFLVLRGEAAFADAAGTPPGSGPVRAAAVCADALDATAVLGAVDSDRVYVGVAPAGSAPIWPPRTDGEFDSGAAAEPAAQLDAGSTADGVLDAAARRWVAGHDVDWTALGQPAAARRVPLPMPLPRPSAGPATATGRPPRRTPRPPTGQGWIEVLDPGGSGPTVLALPYAGGSGRAFRALHRHLPPGCGLAVVDIPGHGRLMDEPCLTSVEDVLTGLDGAVAALGAPELVLLGYSFGGSLAYALAARLCGAGTPPAALVVCGTRAPHTGVGHLPVAHVPAGVPFLTAATAVQLAAPELLDLPDLAAVFAAPLHADLAMVESFPFRRPALLTVPTCVVGFRSDWLVPEPALRAWDDICVDPPLHLRTDGGHLAVHECAEAFGAAVAAALEHVQHAAPTR